MNNKEIMNSMLRSSIGGKMNIGPDGRMELTPEMIEALGISKEQLQNGELEFDRDNAYESAPLSGIPRRPITEDEYDAMPASSKKGIHQLFTTGYLFTLIVSSMMIFFIGTNETLRTNNLMMTYGLCVFIVVLCLVITISTCAKGLSKNSEIAAGEVLLCDVKKRSGGAFHYYLTVSLPESRQCVQRVQCYRSTYKKVKVGSKVYLGRTRAFAANR